MAEIEAAAAQLSVEERRKMKRVPYEAAIQFVEFDGEKIPNNPKYLKGKGVDLSHAGLHFTTAKRPESRSLIVSFMAGRSPARAIVRAVCVRGIQEALDWRYDVHCEFVKWLTKN